jgi:hypothetical protein
MTKFIEVIIEGNPHSINIDNIAMMKRISEFVTEIHLLTKDKNDLPIKFQVLKNYSDFRLILNNENRLAFDFAINTH